MATGGKIDEEKTSESYEKGTIRRLYLENFVTYSSVEFIPGPHLNVIVGPNGTGKSTIVCGICLGLAGKPGLLGRSTAILDYIKHGQQKAVIQVELHKGGSQSIIIRREIVRASSNASSWFVNGKSCTQKTIEELVSALGIQVGNLCQFLPQDKVSDFAKMSQQELLQNTEKTIDMQLFEDHVKLNKAADIQRDIELHLNKTKESLEKETGLNARLEQDVKNNEERECELQKIKQYQMKRPWVVYEEGRQEFERLKTKRNELRKELDTAKGRLDPLRQQCRDAQRQVQVMQQEISVKTGEIRRTSALVTQKVNSFDELDEKSQEVDQEIASKKQDEVNRLNKLRELLQQLRVLKTEMTTSDQQPDLQPAIDRVSEEMRTVNKDMTWVIQTGEGLKQEIFEIVERQKGLREELGRLQDVGRIRLDNLHHIHQDTYNAVVWLRKNKDKFKAPIHEPMILTIDLKDPKYAKYVESQIPFRELRVFICEDGDDLEKFTSILCDEGKLKLNVSMMPEKPADSFVPRFTIDHYRRFQFHSYLRELFGCPEAVMRYLCSMCRVHEVPVGNQFTRQNVDGIIRDCPELNMFYTADHKYTVRKSKYSGLSSTCCSEIWNAQKLSMTGNQQKEKELGDQIQQMNGQKQQKEQEYQLLQSQYRDRETKMNQLRDEKKRLCDKKNEKRTLLQRIGVKEDSIKRLESTAIDIGREETIAKEKKRAISEKKFEAIQSLKTVIQKSALLRMEKVRSCLQQTNLARESNALQKDLQDKEGSLGKLEEKCALILERVEEAKLSAKRLLREAHSLCGIPVDHNLPESLQNTFKLLPNTIDEIDTCIHQLQAKIDCMMAVDNDVIQDFRNREELIARLRRDAEKLKKQFDDHRIEITSAKERWIGPLQQLVGRINVKFSEFFQIMKCAGEVSLKVPENPEDYEKYGICILVKFRDSEQLRELNAFHQSGGERSVSTVLYIMALQELTRCPFRCVDEINQGMDPINERLVFEMVVRTATREHNSQYFLLTPKLLPDLEYSDNMTIHFVHNGPYFLNHKEWSLKKFLKLRSRLNNNRSS